MSTGCAVWSACCAELPQCRAACMSIISWTAFNNCSHSGCLPRGAGKVSVLLCLPEAHSHSNEMGFMSRDIASCMFHAASHVEMHLSSPHTSEHIQMQLSSGVKCPCHALQES